MVKIGRTREDVRSRLHSLQRGNPCKLTLEHKILGDCEAELHRLFSDDRIYRSDLLGRPQPTEWFRLTSEIAFWISCNRPVGVIRDQPYLFEDFKTREAA
jgi:hypothetical protein